MSAIASMLKACGSVGDLKKGRGVHANAAGVADIEGEVFSRSIQVGNQGRELHAEAKKQGFLARSYTMCKHPG